MRLLCLVLGVLSLSLRQEVAKACPIRIYHAELCLLKRFVKADRHHQVVGADLHLVDKHFCVIDTDTHLLNLNKYDHGQGRLRELTHLLLHYLELVLLFNRGRRGNLRLLLRLVNI